MELAAGEQLWWFEGPHETVPADVAAEAVRRTAAVEQRDDLFGIDGLSQTWLAPKQR
jgi:hypothetical protein